VRFRGHFGRAAQLATLAIAGQGLFYLLTVVLARRLGVDGFEAYSVAVAAVVLLASFATWGLEKYAMRVLPSLFERGDWARARGYVRFGLRRTLWTSLLVATVLGVGWAWWATDTPAAARLAVAAGCLALPAVALVQYGVEALSATRYGRRPSTGSRFRPRHSSSSDWCCTCRSRSVAPRP
jgi:O-antigen/teichoic acid export membrane protein